MLVAARIVPVLRVLHSRVINHVRLYGNVAHCKQAAVDNVYVSAVCLLACFAITCMWIIEFNQGLPIKPACPHIFLDMFEFIVRRRPLADVAVMMGAKEDVS